MLDIDCLLKTQGFNILRIKQTTKAASTSIYTTRYNKKNQLLFIELYWSLSIQVSITTYTDIFHWIFQYFSLYCEDMRVCLLMTCSLWGPLCRIYIYEILDRWANNTDQFKKITIPEKDNIIRNREDEINEKSKIEKWNFQ